MVIIQHFFIHTSQPTAIRYREFHLAESGYDSCLRKQSTHLDGNHQWLILKYPDKRVLTG